MTTTIEARIELYNVPEDRLAELRELLEDGTSESDRLRAAADFLEDDDYNGESDPWYSGSVWLEEQEGKAPTYFTRRPTSHAGRKARTMNAIQEAVYQHVAAEVLTGVDAGPAYQEYRECFAEVRAALEAHKLGAFALDLDQVVNAVISDVIRAAFLQGLAFDITALLNATEPPCSELSAWLKSILAADRLDDFSGTGYDHTHKAIADVRAAWLEEQEG